MKFINQQNRDLGHMYFRFKYRIYLCFKLLNDNQIDENYKYDKNWKMLNLII